MFQGKEGERWEKFKKEIKDFNFLADAMKNTNSSAEEVHRAYKKAEATPTINWEKWLEDSHQLTGKYRSGRELDKPFNASSCLEDYFEVESATIDLRTGKYGQRIK